MQCTRVKEALDLVSYLRLGYRVLPCLNGGKRPVIRSGLTAATNDAAKLDRWLTALPSANWGLLPPAQVLVLDVDSPEAAESWLARYPELAQAPQCRTPRGGVHVYLKAASGAALKVRGLSDGSHIRGLGKAYLMVPPSMTAFGCYRWERPLMVPDALPVASDAFLQALGATRLASPSRQRSGTPVGGSDALRRYVLAALRNEQACVARAQRGFRNETLNRAAYALGGYIHWGAVSEQEMTQALLVATETSGYLADDGLGAAIATIQSGLRAGKATPRQLPAQFARHNLTSDGVDCDDPVRFARLAP
jgi:hypothetical protein